MSVSSLRTPTANAHQTATASGTVFLTEANTEINIPQSLDENPQYVTMYQRQIDRERIMASIGISNDEIEGTKEFNSELALQVEYLKEQDRIKRTNEYRQFLEEQEKLKALKEAREAERSQRLERRWQKMMEKVNFNLPSEDYYTTTPLQPGLNFFISLAMHPRVEELRVNMPNSLLIKDKIYWVHFNTAKQKIVMSDDFLPMEFYNSLKKGKEELTYPAILRTPEELSTFRPEILDWSKLYDKIFKSQLPSSGIIQEYIINTSERPCTTRLHLVNNTRDNKSSSAFAMTNTDCALETYHQGKYCLCSDKHDGIEVYPLYGHALARVESQGRKLLDFIHKAYYLRINEIVIDFVRDRAGNYWILNVKGFKLDESIIVARELRENEEKELSKAARQEHRKSKREERLSSMTCKMCLLSYKSFEMDKVLPFKMLLLYKQHVHRSGRKAIDLGHLRVLAVDFLSHWVRLCSVCYMLVIHEYELIETENKLAECMNVPVKNADFMAKEDYQHPAFLPAELPQWRSILYFHSLEFVKPQLNAMKNLHVHYSLFDVRYSFAVSPDWIKDTCATFNIARLYYFFAALDHSVPRFCETLEMPFRLTRGPDWENCIASGISNPFKDFTGQMEEGTAIHQPFKVLLFRNDEEAVRLRFVVGLACDLPVKIKSLPITITKMYGLYLPEESYFSSDPLPPQWLEIFDPKYSLNYSISALESSEELDANYSPLLSSKEIVSQPLCNTKILHVGVDLNPESKLRTGLTSVRSMDSNIGAFSYHGVTSPHSLISTQRTTRQGLPANSPLDYPKSSASFFKKPKRNSDKSSFPSLKSDTAATLGSPKSRDEFADSCFSLRPSFTMPTSPISITEQNSEVRKPRKTEKSLKVAKTKLKRAIKRHTNTAEKLDKQLKLISLYADVDLKKLGLGAVNKQRSKAKAL